MGEIELRCDREPFRQLLAKVRSPRIVEGNLIELPCRDCRKHLRVRTVMHRFNVLGEMVETEVVRRDGTRAMM